MHMRIFLSFAVLLSTSFLVYADLDPAVVKSGTERIQSIISRGEVHARYASTPSALKAQTNNGFFDLHIEQMVQFFNCKTVFGVYMLKHALEHPYNMDVSDGHKIVEQRRDAVALLCSNTLLKEKFDSLLEQARQAEADVLELFSAEFKNRTCPDLVMLQKLQEQKVITEPISRFFIANPVARTVQYCGLCLSTSMFLGTTGIFTYATYNSMIAGGQYGSFLISALYCGALGSFQSYTLIDDYKKAAEKRYKIHALNKLVAVVHELELLCAEYGIVQQFNSHAMKSEATESLVRGIKRSRYAHKNTKVFLSPLVHSFIYTLYENDKQLAGIFSALGELDYLNAIATALIESKERVNTFSFVHFVQQSKPAIVLEKFWNLLIPNPVVNNFDERCNVILTGPNAGGKTSSIKAVLQAIILAQTFGIAPAARASLTPFAVIHSYLNISDDLLKGESLFKAEINRAKEIMDTIKALSAGQKFFFALDELFTGTNGEDGEMCAYKFMLALSKYDSIQFIYATHFNKLKELGAAQRCALYKIDAPTKDEYGKFVYPYTLSRGASTARIALDLAHEAGIF